MSDAVLAADAVVRSYKFRLKDRRAAAHLTVRATAVNQVWNWCAGHQRHLFDRYNAGRPSVLWPSAWDLEKLLKGSAQALDLSANSINLICARFVLSRGKRSRPVRFRASSGANRALGWVPFKGRYAKVEDNSVTFQGQRFRWFGSKRRKLPGPVRTGAFVEDSRGRWWVVFQVAVPVAVSAAAGRIGIDLGLHSLATTSDGEVVENVRAGRAWADKLAVAQRAGNKRRAKAIHAKIANIRKDHLHKASRALVRANGLIVVGDVSASKMVKTRMAKAVVDASWAAFKSMLRYKSQQAGAVFLEVNEAWTSRTCSACGIIPVSSPKGVGMLRVRAWVCDDCGASHDRDVNAARNILNLGLSAQPQGGSRGAMTADRISANASRLSALHSEGGEQKSECGDDSDKPCSKCNCWKLTREMCS